VNGTAESTTWKRERCSCTTCATRSAEGHQRRLRHHLVWCVHVLLNGESVKSCTVLAAQVAGEEVTTIEGLALETGGCTGPAGLPGVPRVAVRLLHAGMVMAITSLLAENPDPTEEYIALASREPLSLHRLSQHRGAALAASQALEMRQ